MLSLSKSGVDKSIDYLKKRLSEPSTHLALLSVLTSGAAVFGYITNEQAVWIAGALTGVIAGVPDKQHIN